MESEEDMTECELCGCIFADDELTDGVCDDCFDAEDEVE